MVAAKQWDDNDGDDQQQGLQYGLGNALLTTMATSAMLTITATAATATMMKIITTNLDRGGGCSGGSVSCSMAAVNAVAVTTAGAYNNQQKAAAG